MIYWSFDILTRLVDYLVVGSGYFTCMSDNAPIA
jgi:hypothetical protein